MRRSRTDQRRDYYRRELATSSGIVVKDAIVPANVERVEIHAPCTYCGTARGACRHRII